MANKWTDAVACLLDMKSVPKAVLGALAFHSDNESGQSWPSIRLICRETGYKETAVKSALKLLEANEFISKAGTKPAKNGEVNVWEINRVGLQRGLDTTGSLYEPPPGRTTTVTGSPSDGDGVATRRRNSSVELEKRTRHSNTVLGGTERSVEQESEQSHDAPQVAQAARPEAKTKTSVPKIQGKISVEPAIVPDEEMIRDAQMLSNMWEYFKLPGKSDDQIWFQLISKYGVETVQQVIFWMMYMNHNQYWLKKHIFSMRYFARCFPKMHEQYEKCGGAELEEALGVAHDRFIGMPTEEDKKAAIELYGGGPVAPRRFPNVCVGNCKDYCPQCHGESEECFQREDDLQTRLAAVHVDEDAGLRPYDGDGLESDEDDEEGVNFNVEDVVTDSDGLD